jgi:hypothetical protein
MSLTYRLVRIPNEARELHGTIEITDQSGMADRFQRSLQRALNTPAKHRGSQRPSENNPHREEGGCVSAADARVELSDRKFQKKGFQGFQPMRLFSRH